MKAERLGLDVEIEIVAEALAGLRTEVGAVGFGRAEQTELHYAALVSVPERDCVLLARHFARSARRFPPSRPKPVEFAIQALGLCILAVMTLNIARRPQAG